MSTHLDLNNFKYVKFKYHRVKLFSILQYHKYKGYVTAKIVLDSFKKGIQHNTNYLLVSV